MCPRATAASFRIVKAQARDASRDVRRVATVDARPPPHCKTCSFPRAAVPSSHTPQYVFTRSAARRRGPQSSSVLVRASIAYGRPRHVGRKQELSPVRSPSAERIVQPAAKYMHGAVGLHAAAGPPCDLSRNGPKPPVASQTSRLLSRLSQLLSLSLTPRVGGGGGGFAD